MTLDQAHQGAKRLQIAMLVFPGMTLLDMVGPQAVFGHHADTHLAWKELSPVLSDTAVAVLPTTTFAGCPKELDVLFVPGGLGTWDAMADEEVLDFLRERAATSALVTSVCSGSILLAAAGLLDGRKAATHWATYEILEAFGIEGVRERVVTDGNRISGGGVTAGIDFGLAVLARLRGEDVAKTTQLMLEYDPAPPFDAGSPDRSEPEIVGNVMAILAEGLERASGIARSLAARRSARAAV
jgi:cyclohexyl-isocyanide hydratase